MTSTTALACNPLDTNPLRLLAARALTHSAYAIADLACLVLPQNHPTRTFMHGRTQLSRGTALDSLRGPRDRYVKTGAAGLIAFALGAGYDLLTLTPLI